MKIVSLQSVGLGAIFSGGEHVNGFGFNEPYIITVGENLHDGRGYSLNVTVTEINHIKPYQSFEYYEAKTSDGHIRVLPADKYIAEWSE